MAIATVFVRTPNSHLFFSVPRQLLQRGEPPQRTGFSAFSVVQKNHFSTAEAQRTQSKELANEEVV
jgi:hypothetical protein